jgi:hypothetical protein
MTATKIIRPRDGLLEFGLTNKTTKVSSKYVIEDVI